MAIYTHYEIANSPSGARWYVMGGSYTFTSSLITFTNQDGTLTKAQGSFFIVNGSIFGGTISALERTSAGGQTVYESITGFSTAVIPFLAESPQNRLSNLVFDGDDQFYGYSGDDPLHGSHGKDLFVAGAGDDKLHAWDGEADKLIGGLGDDAYTIDALDTVIEQPGQGIDTVQLFGPGTYQLPDNVENASSIGSGIVHVIGNGLDNTLHNILSNSIVEGGDGDDTIRDDGNNNRLKGGRGDDLYYVGPIAVFDTVIDELPGEGNDTVITERHGFTLDPNVEGLAFASGDPHTGWGNENDNFMIGNAGKDMLHGLGGNDDLRGTGGGDLLFGGVGDDTYRLSLNDADAEVVELPNEGTDTVKAAFALFKIPDNVENLDFHGEVAFGNDLDNVMRPLAGSHVELHGLKGNDTLHAYFGEALLDGGEGDDTAAFAENLGDWSLFDRGDRVFATIGAKQSVAVDVEHLRFNDGTIDCNDASALFDTIYYMSHNLDVFHAGANALGHFNAFGRHEGRDPNAFFDTAGYLSAYKDVAAGGMNPLDHYHQIGRHQGYDPSAAFDTTLYLLRNPDVAAAGLDPLEHYLRFGMAEGRQAHAAVGASIAAGFDAEHYLRHNADVAAAGVDPLAHFQAFGRHEGRNPNGWFDTAGYLAHYADVAAAGVNPLDHYMAFGWQEGRDPSAQFDTAGYLAANPDVAAAHVDPLEHFLTFGIYEGRQAVNDGVWG